MRQIASVPITLDGSDAPCDAEGLGLARVDWNSRSKHMTHEHNGTTEASQGTTVEQATADGVVVIYQQGNVNAWLEADNAVRPEELV